MTNRKAIEEYCCDLSKLSEFLSQYVSSYRLLIGGACELNQITPARRSDVKHALDRVNKLGDIIDELLCAIDRCQCDYIEYCEIKADVIKCRIKKRCIEEDINDICGDKRLPPKPPPKLT
ncbi:hypothetical protein [Clostridium felsineum]|uniref:Uncharacterized protein n=1 Tax=Clostridium felsineum TaxID=36839 RepID=A0A1S8LJS4_9CLOT|nr:hypothetical protein [Clostridium felsineum]MCR3758832.1 hypothetical protein [Clostridium felsineum]URZ01754.1 hypothetical protein CLAUR_017500 [Clostridium felsineum]URZ05388.1 hypothetical protein CLROS_007130 [Clostridium felsineum]URZ10429.1 hypothetical protein CROST_011380 [Clostridium felsineum]URZ17642.1 hypothetical protein CLFE_036960 [Clostridium felsineum DSM 794]